MKTTVIGLVLAAIFWVACNKHNDAATPGNRSIAGKWNVDSVNLYFYNAAGILDSSEVGYPIPVPGFNYPLYFQFNEDYTWLEALVVRIDTDIVAKGTYMYTSGNTFNLMYPDAIPARRNEPCNIISLTSTSFIFSKQLPRVLNGTDSGYIKYVFRMTK
jgi:hypothetical protein